VFTCTIINYKVLPLDIVDNSTSPSRAHFELVFSSFDCRDLAFSALIGYTTITIDSIYFAANFIGGMYG
jgi:hypothetical protein